MAKSPISSIKERRKKSPHGEPLAFLRNVVLKHTEPECLKWPYSITNNGYGNMRYEGKVSLVATILCTIVRGPRPSSAHHVRHLCGKGQEACCSPHHVDWGTVVENMADKLDHGTHNRGIRHPLVKLTEADVVQIRDLCSKGIPQKAIASQFGIQQMQVSRIHRRERWGHI